MAYPGGIIENGREYYLLRSDPIMRIKKHIHLARSILFWQDVLVSLLWTGIIASLLFLIGVELETVFYFLPKTMIFIISFICVALITYCLF